ncbi:MAG: TIGR04283 family arsenosugar biosynthesis glycosyltransferase [Thermoanaerobaculia bacterium]
MISVIVPIRNEGPEVAARFAQFARRPDAELLIADGGGDARTSAAFTAAGARVVAAEGSRGRCLDLAAREARGQILLFYHADSRPPENALEAVREALEDGAVAGAFSLAYENAGPGMRWIAWWANTRSRLLGLPFGDQGLFCRREDYERAGRFRDIPICDDLDLVRRLRLLGPVAIRREKSVTSPRRYRETGPLRQMLRNWRVQIGYFAGVDPETLARWYSRGAGNAVSSSSRRRRPE